MKRILLMSLCLVSILQVVFGGEGQVLVTVENPSGLTRRSETISLNWDVIKKNAAELSPANIMVTDQKSGTPIQSQSVGDEFLFQSDLGANETRTFVLKAATPGKQEPQSKVDGSFMKPREDYAWENDRIAFRVYGPALAKEVSNGIDVWVKRVRDLVVRKWYKGDEDTGSARVSYHIDHGEGADFFNVGRTLGAGGSAIWHNKKVYQPGVFSSYKTIANGPIRTVFELYYDSLNVDGMIYREVSRISLDAGQNLNTIQVTYTSPKSSEQIEIAAGLVKRPNTIVHKDVKNCWIDLWGLTNEDSITGNLGTGVVMPKSAYKGMAEDNDQYLIVGQAKSGHHVTYYAGAGWTRSGDFSSVEDWNTYLTEFSIRLRSPLKVKITSGGN